MFVTDRRSNIQTDQLPGWSKLPTTYCLSIDLFGCFVLGTSLSEHAMLQTKGVWKTNRQAGYPGRPKLCIDQFGAVFS